MLIDDVKIRVSAGHGGHGRVSFQKIKMALGPTGASGGRGGDVCFLGVSDIGALNQFRHNKDFTAKGGGEGGAQFRDGANAPDLVLSVPTGTVIHNEETGVSRELVKVGERLVVARGGRGGRGNFHFRSPVNTSPKESEEGKPGESYNLHLELRLIADVGFVGLPNVGKSSLLNALTRASAKVANYPFTTLEPNLGAYFDLIIADIPGLIEGASAGKGLGVKFLRHVRRTKVLFHLVSAESDDPVRDWLTVRTELGAYDSSMLEKKEYLFLSKCDMVTAKEKEAKLSALRKVHDRVIPISVLEESWLGQVKEMLGNLLEEKTVK